MIDTVGKWPGILSHLGIDVGSGKHGPCPACGGTDRYRFDDRDGKGTYFCNQCGPGDGFGLVRKVYGCSFTDALRMVTPIVGDIPKQTRRQRKLTDKKDALNRLRQSSKPLVAGDPVMVYLGNRGITMVPQSIRYCPACYESETKKKMPAMIARVTAPDGTPVTLHRTYIEGGKKAEIKSVRKLMPHDSDLTGAAVRLWPAEEEMGVAEGIETAMSAAQLFGVPVWAALTAGGLEKFQPSEKVKKLLIFSDNDGIYKGQMSAYTLANRLSLKGLKVTVEIPDLVGDFNDMLTRRQ